MVVTGRQIVCTHRVHLYLFARYAQFSSSGLFGIVYVMSVETAKAVVKRSSCTRSRRKMEDDIRIAYIDCCVQAVYIVDIYIYSLRTEKDHMHIHIISHAYNEGDGGCSYCSRIYVE